MERDAILAALRAREAELRAMGVEGLSLFGSAARGEAGRGADVDLAVRLRAGRQGLGHLRRLEALRRRLARIVGRPVDLVEEPVERLPLRQELERDRVRAF
jgi:predicted nucleotidyltransferase